MIPPGKPIHAKTSWINFVQYPVKESLRDFLCTWYTPWYTKVKIGCSAPIYIGAFDLTWEEKRKEGNRK